MAYYSFIQGEPTLKALRYMGEFNLGQTCYYSCSEEKFKELYTTGALSGMSSYYAESKSYWMYTEEWVGSDWGIYIECSEDASIEEVLNSPVIMKAYVYEDGGYEKLVIPSRSNTSLKYYYPMNANVDETQKVSAISSHYNGIDPNFNQFIITGKGSKLKPEVGGLYNSTLTKKLN